MSHHDTANTLYQATQAAEQKFEYFITGAIGAMFAYSVQSFIPRCIDSIFAALEPVAIICFAVAFLCGLRRMECLFNFLGISYEKNLALGDAKVTEEALRRMAADPIQYRLREGLSVEAVAKDAQADRSRAKSADPLLDSLGKKVRTLHHWRNRLMIAGFFLIFSARIVTPYLTSPKRPIPRPVPVSQPVPTSQPSTNPAKN
ncbi:hypothetical protein [Luteolibacter sp. AS25]|uniref:hypothetical protein n=1 Tax=Luteolibacter sp. AS25 TaxID=3135776 RepID=UPI00398A5B76